MCLHVHLRGQEKEIIIIIDPGIDSQLQMTLYSPIRQRLRDDGAVWVFPTLPRRALNVHRLVCGWLSTFQAFWNLSYNSAPTDSLTWGLPSQPSTHTGNSKILCFSSFYTNWKRLPPALRLYGRISVLSSGQEPGGCTTSCRLPSCCDTLHLWALQKSPPTTTSAPSPPLLPSFASPRDDQWV